MQDFVQVKDVFSKEVLHFIIEVVENTQPVRKEDADVKGYRWILNDVPRQVLNRTYFEIDACKLAYIDRFFEQTTTKHLFKSLFQAAKINDTRLRIYKPFKESNELLIDLDLRCPFERGENVGVKQTQKKHKHRIDFTQDMRYLTIGFNPMSKRVKNKAEHQYREYKNKRRAYLKPY